MSISRSCQRGDQYAGAKGVNIATMQLYRDHPGGNAVMIIETDKAVPQESLTWLESCEGITRVTFIDAEREE